jgi:hypothetical protein
MKNRTRALVVSVGLVTFASLLPAAHALAGAKWS